MKRIRFRTKKHSTRVISKVNQSNKYSIEEIHAFIDNFKTTAATSTIPPSFSHRPAKQKRNSTSRKTLRYVSAAVALIFIGILIFTFIVPVLQGNTHVLTVLSGSMAPGINPGDIVISTHIDPQSIGINDVITFSYASNPKNSVTHRVVNITTTEAGLLQFQTKGDANKDPDRRWVQQSEVVGKVSVVIPLLGYVSSFVKTRLGFFIIIAVPAALIILQEIWTIYKEHKKKITVKNQ